MANILVVDDDASIRKLLRKTLERDGQTVIEAANAAEAELQCAKADLLLLDVMMPGEDGFSLCRRIRGRVDCPILFLTAKEAEADAVTGFGLGADDYITKPFRLTELRARVQAHLRRQMRVPTRHLCDGNISMDLSARIVYVGETPLALTKAEYSLCEVLLRQPGQAFSRTQLLEAAFGYDSDSYETAITEHIKNLRAKLLAQGLAPIETVWGIGYRWKKQDESKA